MFNVSDLKKIIDEMISRKITTFEVLVDEKSNGYISVYGIGKIKINFYTDNGTFSILRDEPENRLTGCGTVSDLKKL